MEKDCADSVAAVVVAALAVIAIFTLKTVSKDVEENVLFEEGLTVVKSADKYGYINKKGEYVINPQFEYASSFSEGLAAVKVDDKYGYIDKSGKYVINPQYPKAYSFFDDGYAVVLKDNKTFSVIDKKGKELFDMGFEGIGEIAGSICEKDGCYDFANYDNDTHCYTHRKSSSLPYCDAYGCLNRVSSIFNDYCSKHSYME